jgi:hypothetical protein
MSAGTRAMTARSMFRNGRGSQRTDLAPVRAVPFRAFPAACTAPDNQGSQQRFRTELTEWMTSATFLT